MAKKTINYSARIANMNRAMINEMWNIIEKRAALKDNRYYAPRQFLERTFDKGEEFCKVDFGGHDYGVTGIRLEQHWSGSRSISIMAHDGYDYCGLDTESVCVVLSALRRQRPRKAA